MAEEKPCRSLVKAISWRVTGMCDPLLVSWYVTGEFTMALDIATAELFTKLRSITSTNAFGISWISAA